MPRGLYNLDFRTWNTKLGRKVWQTNQPIQFYTKEIWTKPTGITAQSVKVTWNSNSYVIDQMVGL